MRFADFELLVFAGMSFCGGFTFASLVYHIRHGVAAGLAAIIVYVIIAILGTVVYHLGKRKFQ